MKNDKPYKKWIKIVLATSIIALLLTILMHFDLFPRQLSFSRARTNLTGFYSIDEFFSAFLKILAICYVILICIYLGSKNKRKSLYDIMFICPKCEYVEKLEKVDNSKVCSKCGSEPMEPLDGFYERKGDN